MNARPTDIEARKRKLGHGTMQESKRLGWQPDTGQVVPYRMPPGVLSGIVLRSWESHEQGEGPDGSTQPAKASRPGYSWTGIRRANLPAGNSNQGRKQKKQHRFRDHVTFFDHMDHDWLLKMLEQRIDDRAFLGLIRKWLKAGVLEIDGQVIHSETGTPQGGIVSPVLANVYLHYAQDLWFERMVKKHSRGKAVMIRYADDWVCAFQHEADAERYYRTLPKRLKKFGLEVAEEKTNCLPFSRKHLGKGRRFVFLGFEFYWDKDRKGQARVKRRTAPKKLQGARCRIKAWIKANRHLSKREFVGGLNRRLTGHYNYFGIIGNGQSINRFYRWAMDCTFKWLNRRGGKRKSFSWDAFWRTVDSGLFRKPRIMGGTNRRGCV